MPDWIPWAVYIAGWLIACRVLARYVPARDAGLPGLGMLALFWPLMAVVALLVLPVWLVTRGVDRD